MFNEGLALMEYIVATLLAAILMLLGYIAGSLTTLRRQTDDLWSWHKPDDNGMQTWKLTRMLISQVVDEVDAHRRVD